MEKQNNIQKELQSLSPLLAELRKHDPFKVPTNYFEQLYEDALEVNKTDIQLSEQLSQLQKDNPFKVPKAYFETLTKETMQTLQFVEASADPNTDFLATFHQMSAFKVPPDYFEQLTANIQELIRFETSDLEAETAFLDDITQTESFKVPAQYFDQLGSSIMNAIQDSAEATAEAETTSSLLESIPKTEQGFTIPSNYFEQFQAQMMDKVREEATETAETQWIEKRVGKYSPFLVPEGYFDEFYQRVMQLVRQTSDGAKVIPMQPKRSQDESPKIWRRVLSVAAIALVFFMVLFTLNLSQTGTNSNNPMAELSESLKQYKADKNTQELIASATNLYSLDDLMYGDVVEVDSDILSQLKDGLEQIANEPALELDQFDTQSLENFLQTL